MYDEEKMETDVALLREAAKIIESMEIEANVYMANKIADNVFEDSTRLRAFFLQNVLKAMEGSTAEGVMKEACAIWNDTGAAIDDYLNYDGSSKRLNNLADRLLEGYHSDDYED